MSRSLCEMVRRVPTSIDELRECIYPTQCLGGYLTDDGGDRKLGTPSGRGRVHIRRAAVLLQSVADLEPEILRRKACFGVRLCLLRVRSPVRGQPRRAARPRSGRRSRRTRPSRRSG